MTIQRLGASRRMSEAVIHGDTVYLAGQVGEGATVAEQTRDALREVEGLLVEAGSDKSRILSATIWLADMADFDEMNSVWDAWVDGKDPPARATGEARLAAPQYKVEVIVIAAR
jgi:enamine deaminase RidA (YjgF/YER057c/UK114 family)